MNRLPTVKIQHRVTGATKILNYTKYAADMGAWSDWKLIENRERGVDDRAVVFERQQEEIERIRANNPKSPAYSDPKVAYEARALTTATNVVAPPEKEEAAKEVTSAVNVITPTTVAPVEREVPVIGGKQVVKMRGRPPKSTSDNEVL